MKMDKNELRDEYKRSDFTSLERGQFYREVVMVTAPDLPEADASARANPAGDDKGSVAATLALLRSPEFLSLPKADPAEVEQRIRELRDDWEGSRCDQPSSP